LLAKFAALLARLRSPLLTRRARVRRFSLAAGLFLFARFAGVVGFALFGGIARRSCRLCRLGQLNPAHDFVGYFGIRIHDDTHGDVEIVSPLRGRRLRERRRNEERQHQGGTQAPRKPHDALTTHALSSPGAATCSATFRRRVRPSCSISATTLPSPGVRPITGSDNRFAPRVSEVFHSISCCCS